MADDLSKRGPPDAIRIDYFVELTTRGSSILQIKDFRYVPYITVDAAIEIAPTASKT